MTEHLRIVVGVTGGIAAYKALSVIRAFVRDGHDVVVVATESALNFVGRASFEALSRNPVAVGLYDEVAQVQHVRLGQTADLVVVAPATANTIASMAAGLAPDLLGNVLLATRGHVVVAPAMHTEMWLHPATSQNIDTLRSRGVTVVGPASGALTGDDVGIGRMAEPDDIVTACYSVVQGGARSDYSGLHVLISAGGTREPIDPVRFLGNRSSGRQAIALATAALSRGARVTVVAAHLDVSVPVGVEVVSAPTARDMLTAMQRLAPQANVVIMAAAVADYRLADVPDVKMSKDSTGASLTLQLEQTEDVLAAIAQSSNRTNTIVGFAAETVTGDELIAAARAKLERKGCDFLVANSVSWQAGFEASENDVIIMCRRNDKLVRATGTKQTVAHRILDELL